MTSTPEVRAKVEADIASTINDNGIAEHNVLYARSQVHLLAAERRRMLMDQVDKRIAAVTADVTMAGPAKQHILQQLEALRATINPGFYGYNGVNDTIRNTFTPNQQYATAAGAGVVGAGLVTLGLWSWNKSDTWYKKAGAAVLGALSLPLFYMGMGSWQAPQERARQDVAVRTKNNVDLWNRLRAAGPIDLFGNAELQSGQNILLAAPETILQIGGKFVRIQQDDGEVIILVANAPTMAGARRWVIDISYDRPAAPTSPEGVTFNALQTQGLLENPTGPNPTFLRTSAMLGRGGAGMQREQGELLLGGRAGATGPAVSLYMSRAKLEELVTAIAAVPAGTATGQIANVDLFTAPPTTGTPPPARPSLTNRTVRFTEVTRPAPGTPERAVYDAVNGATAQTALTAIAGLGNAGLSGVADLATHPVFSARLTELNALVPVAQRANTAIQAAATARIAAILRGRPDGDIFIRQDFKQYRLVFGNPGGFALEEIVLAAGPEKNAVDFINGAAATAQLEIMKNTADTALTGVNPQATAAVGTALTTLNAGVPAGTRTNASVQAAAVARIATLVGPRPGAGNVFTVSGAAPPSNRFRLAFSSANAFEFVPVT